ncbi:MAG TPA: hypothetical protein VFF06_31120 [Polyangia bacterium]|nr:hypothetical protein [Polyangia bacterium]
MTDELFNVLRDALATDGTRVSVRTDGAIAEVLGPLEIRRGDEWLTLGADGGSHVHVKTAAIAALRFSAPPDGNAALEVVNADGARLCRVGFARADRERAIERFGHLGQIAAAGSRDG